MKTRSEAFEAREVDEQLFIAPSIFVLLADGF
jgi:hypothetical protein